MKSYNLVHVALEVARKVNYWVESSAMILKILGYHILTSALRMVLS